MTARTTGSHSPMEIRISQRVEVHGSFGRNEPTGHFAPSGPLMSPGFWLHHAAPPRVPPTGFEPVPPP